jgi:protein-disulfide isomerase
MSEKNSGLTSIYTPVLVLLLIVASFFVGRLSSQVSALKNAAPAPVVQGVNDPQQPATPTVSLDLIKGLFDKDVIKFGDKNKKIVFVEVSDPSCPYCGAASGLNGPLNKQMGPQFTLVSDGGTYVAPVTEMKKLLDQKKIGYVWIYSNGHGAGEMGAKALYCAQEKGKFWDAHSLLFSAAGYDMMNNTVKNDVAKSGELSKFLAKAVDQNFMNGCLSSDKYKDRIQADIAVARELGVNGTPGFFVNASNFPGAVSYNDMKSIVDAAL